MLPLRRDLLEFVRPHRKRKKKNTRSLTDPMKNLQANQFSQ